MTRTVTTALGKQTTYQFVNQTPSGSAELWSLNQWVLSSTNAVAATNSPASSTALSYASGTGFLSSGTDENGNVTTYVRNAAGQETSRTEASGTSAARTITTSWATGFSLPAIITEPTHSTAFTYDSNGNVLTKTITDLTNYTTPYATNGLTRTWTYTYTTQGLLHTATGPISGSTITYAYNANGYLNQVTDPLGHVTRITAWDGRGDPMTVVDPNGVTTTLTYDMDGHPLTATINPGSAQSEYQFAYDAVGDLTQITLPAGATLQYTYDSARRVTLVTNNRGETQAYTYNANSDVLSATVKNASGTITKQQTAAFDELGRIIQAIGAAGASTQTTTLAYDKVSNLTSVTDPKSNTRQNAFDPLYRVITQTDPASNTVQYAYDAQDNLTKLTDGRGLQTTRTVDGFGEVIQEVSPDRGTRSYWYDAAGNLTKLVDGDGEEKDFTYDIANRLTGRTFPGVSAETDTFTYDQTAGGNAGVGRLTAVTDEAGSSSFVYDAQGRITSYVKVLFGQAYTLGYAYDVNGNVTQITYPSGRIVNIARATDGKVTGVTMKASSTSASVNVATAVTYDPFGPLTSLTYGNGLNLTRTYDQNYWLTRIQVNTSSLTRLDLSYAWFNDGRLNGITDNASTGRSTLLNYNNAGQLTYTVGPWGTEVYSYDAAGNRTGAFTTVNGVTTTDNEITWGAANKMGQTQDAGGNVLRNFTYRPGGDLYQDQHTGGATYTYLYNAHKRIVNVENNGTQVGGYFYDAFGRRVIRGNTSGDIEYVFDPSGHLLAEYNADTGAVQKEYVWIDELPVAVVDSTSGTANTYYIHTGVVNEPQMLTSSTQAVAWTAYVKPYGLAQLFTSPATTFDLRLPGQWLQLETNGLYQNGMRDYDPSLGRYIEADPLGIDAGQNIYAYALGDPYDLTDAPGLTPAGALVGGEIGGWIGGLAGEGVEPAGGGIPGAQLGSTLGSFIGNLISNSVLNSNDKSAEAISRANYHKICDEPPPPGLCGDDLKKWKLNKAMMCKQARQEHADNFYNGKFDQGHTTQMEQLQKAIDKLQSYFNGK